MPQPREQDHLSFLDYIRGVAIALVFLYHAVGIDRLAGNMIGSSSHGLAPLQSLPVFFNRVGVFDLKWNGLFRDFHDVPPSIYPLLPVTLGWVGVALFFVISGFCIHLSFERSRTKSVADFYIRRFFRIYPPYLLALLIFSFIYPYCQINLFSRNNLVQFGAHLFLLHNLSAFVRWGICGPFWSIGVEFQLYLIYPALLFLARRCGWFGALAITAAIELAIRAADGWSLMKNGPSMPLDFLVGSPLGFWFSWSIGAYVAECFLTGKAQALANSPRWAWALLFVGAALVKPLEPLCFPLAALFTASWIAAWLSLPRTYDFAKLPFYRHLCFVGVVSYSLYLLHQPVLQHLGWLMSGRLSFHPILIISLLAWFPMLGISWVFHKFVELPSIEWGKMILRKRRASVSPSPDASPVLVLRPDETRK